MLRKPRIVWNRFSPESTAVMSLPGFALARSSLISPVSSEKIDPLFEGKD